MVNREGNELFPGGDFRPYVGCDESGKGDYFGPLVVAGVGVSGTDVARKLTVAGARDSKKLSDARARAIAEAVKRIAPARALVLEPVRYNKLYEGYGNLSAVLSSAYARVIEGLCDEMDCELAIVDRFGKEDYLETAGAISVPRLEIYQIPGAEKYPGVAAASVVARAAYLEGLDRLSAGIGIVLPKGSTEVVETGREVVERYGPEKLGELAKLHFKTTNKILGAA